MGPMVLVPHFFKVTGISSNVMFVRRFCNFFSSGWILPSYHSNIIMLIPKSKNVDSLDQFRPVALANFKFKIIADMLASLILYLISQQQCDFIKGKNIKDYIFLTSDAINLLDSKAWCGNIALKVDITKAFDTLSWTFPLKVLHQFGFNTTFCQWINNIIHSACLSISINGVFHGFLSVLGEFAKETLCLLCFLSSGGCSQQEYHSLG